MKTDHWHAAQAACPSSLITRLRVLVSQVPSGQVRGGFRAPILFAACMLVASACLIAGPPGGLRAEEAKSHGDAEKIADVPEPADYRTDEYRTPVPKTLKGAKVVTPDEAEELHAGGAAVFIDVYPRVPRPPNLPAGTVWRDPAHSSIGGAHWLPNVGYGVLSAEFETYFKSRLETLTGKDQSKPVVFFCLKDCWMSWNAAKRALAWGYTSVIWFPEGTDGWQGLGNDLVVIKPVE